MEQQRKRQRKQQVEMIEQQEPQKVGLWGGRT